MQPFSWIFVDGASQETFRIRLDDPMWQASEGGDWENAKVVFHVTTEDGTTFDFLVEVSRDVLEAAEVQDVDAFLEFLGDKGVDVVEKALHSGVRDDRRLLWMPEGITVSG